MISKFVRGEEGVWFSEDMGVPEVSSEEWLIRAIVLLLADGLACIADVP